MSQYLCPASAHAKKNKLEQGNIRFYSEKETDWLTGLYNREAMDYCIHKERAFRYHDHAGPGSF